MRIGLRRIVAAMAIVWLASPGCGSESGKDTGPRTATGGPDRAATPVSRPAARDERPAMLIVGTSLTEGLGLDPDSAYPAVLQRKLDSAGIAFRVVNGGESGETSAGALRRIDWLLRDTARVVVIETGANDGLRAQLVDSTQANLRAIIRRVRAALPAATVMLVQMEAPPNLGPDYTSRFRAMYPAVAREEGAILIPFLLDGVAGVPELNQADGIHPNEEGARRVAANVFRSVAPVLRRLR
ncbi:MAG: arylesterase [Gemmatimonadaceae bacterium]|nr:arylesterase [Gemmatimonadaceae bacterium]